LDPVFFAKFFQIQHAEAIVFIIGKGDPNFILWLFFGIMAQLPQAGTRDDAAGGDFESNISSG
jgi:hypothetical protein